MTVPLHDATQIMQRKKGVLEQMPNVAEYTHSRAAC